MNISEYRKAGFKGLDICLEISLKEYGLIWKKYKRDTPKRGKKGEYLFIYGVEHDGQEYTSTDYGYLEPSELAKEDWIEWDNIANFIGCEKEELTSLDFGYLVYSLVQYYGIANVFGAY